VHGLAGSAAVALLVLATVHGARRACAYLGVFALGTLAGMALVTTGLSLPLSLLAARFPSSPQAIRRATGALSLGFGVWLVWQLGWHDGLFSAAPHWTPN
jgi:high-affinity nickel-transport protein